MYYNFITKSLYNERILGNVCNNILLGRLFKNVNKTNFLTTKRTFSSDNHLSISDGSVCDSSSISKLNKDLTHHRNYKEHDIVDIMDDSSVSRVGVLSRDEFLYNKRTNLIDKEMYKNLKPHEARKYISSKEDEYYTFDKTKDDLVIDRSKIPSYNTMIEKSKVLGRDEIDQYKRSFKNDKLVFQDDKIYNKSNEDYYKSFFKDRERVFDGMGKQIKSIENDIINSNTKIGNRTRISPYKYWINPNYKSPEIEDIKKLNTFDLKFVMMNEAKLYTNHKTINHDIWECLIDRVIGLYKSLNIRTILRCLHSISIPKIESPKVNTIIDMIYSRKNEMKAKHYVYLLQALSRLRIRDERVYDDLYEMMLCWPILRNNFIIKGANAISKLGVTDNLVLKPLKDVLSNRINELTGRECRRIKPITVMDLFSDEIIVEFLNKCEYHKSYFKNHRRNIEIIELYLRLMKPSIYNNLKDETKEFMSKLREESNNQKYDDLKKKGRMFSSLEHEDLSRIMAKMNINHQNSIKSGPFNFDIYEPSTRTVIEVNNKYQYYNKSSNLTSSAKRRHELISAMGFRMLHIPYRCWNGFESDESKIEYIKSIFVKV